MNPVITYIVSNTVLKYFCRTSLYKKLFLLSFTLLTFFWDLRILIFTLLFLSLLDYITGVKKNLFYRGVKNRSIFSKQFRVSIQSRLTRQSYYKVKDYFLGVVIFSILESAIGRIEIPIAIGEENFSLTEVSLLIPIGIEVWSIFENREAITGNNILKTGLNIFKKPSK